MKWSDEAPPHVGWWNVLIADEQPSQPDPNKYWGWWNGEYWSCFAPDTFTAEAAAERACQQGSIAEPKKGVYWNDYWPKYARVARIVP